MSPGSLLKKISMFEALSIKDREELAQLLRYQTIKKGEILFRKGDEGTALYLIKSGRIRIVLKVRLEDEMTLAVLSDGDFFGEMSLLDGLPRSSDASAHEDTELYVLNRTDFIRFLMHSEHAMKAILYTLSTRLRKTDDLLGETAFLNISSRLAKRLVELAETRGIHQAGSMHVELTLTQKELASLVGVSRESINKELKRWRARNLVATSRNRLIITDLAAIRKHVR